MGPKTGRVKCRTERIITIMITFKIDGSVSLQSSSLHECPSGVFGRVRWKLLLNSNVSNEANVSYINECLVVGDEVQSP